MSNLCQKARFQISSSTKNGFIKSTFINKKKKKIENNFMTKSRSLGQICAKKQICVKKQILLSNLQQKDLFKSNFRPKKIVKSILRQKADRQVQFITKSELSNQFCYIKQSLR